MRHHAITEDDIVAVLTRSAVTVGQLAARLGVGRQTVWDHLKRLRAAGKLTEEGPKHERIFRIIT